MNPVIQVENLSKYYRLGLIGGGTLNEDMHRWIAKMRGKPDPLLKLGENDHGNRKDGQIWALKDVNLEVNEGEILGIIGRNGAGKSTLLKILSKITAPTNGRIKIKGRIGSLLEVGTGFHPELTGRENIYLNGTILGMSRFEVTSKLEEIVSFAEMSEFIDTPVKRYSSGMRVRLAFAVAAHLEPEILIVDEVLAVGDAAFQKRCLGKMKDVAGQGRTILFVSHNMTSIKSLCTRAFLLEKGTEHISGDVDKVVNEYLSDASTEVHVQEWKDSESAPGNREVRVKKIEVRPLYKTGSYVIDTETAIDICFEFRVYINEKINLSMVLKKIDGTTVFATPSSVESMSLGLARFTCHIPADLLNDDIYSVTMMIVRNARAIYVLEEAVIFEVHDVKREGAWHGKWIGVVRPKLVWNYEADQ